MGTIGYQDPETDKVPIPELYEKRQHYHMVKVNQIPKTCECRWNHNNDFNHQYTGPIHYKWINLNSSPRRPPAYPY